MSYIIFSRDPFIQPWEVDCFYSTVHCLEDISKLILRIDLFIKPTGVDFPNSTNPCLEDIS